MNHVRAEGHVPGRTELYTDAMARLERIGILRATSDFSTAPRRVVVPDWPTARAMIEAAEAGRPGSDRLYPGRFPDLFPEP